ncbi:unnamed protein product [Symbiodinium natans]|uniref:Uncharacterized protein n=1 Tax=Symbiodinium natans TaxID=878477 RepID=A0A812LYH4_9DINO|nr:unnamed protein product [Symbiodinium natans]
MFEKFGKITHLWTQALCEAQAARIAELETKTAKQEAQIAELRMLLARSGTTPRGDSSPRSARRAEAAGTQPRTSISPKKSRQQGSTASTNGTSVGTATADRSREGDGLAVCAAQIRGQAGAGSPGPPPQRAQVIAEAAVVASQPAPLAQSSGPPTRHPAGLLASPCQDGRQALLTPRLAPPVAVVQEVAHPCDYPGLLSPAYGSRSIFAQAPCASPRVPPASPSGSMLMPSRASLVPGGSLHVAPPFEQRTPSPCGVVSGGSLRVIPNRAQAVSTIHLPPRRYSPPSPTAGPRLVNSWSSGLEVAESEAKFSLLWTPGATAVTYASAPRAARVPEVPPQEPVTTQPIPAKGEATPQPQERARPFRNAREMRRPAMTD